MSFKDSYKKDIDKISLSEDFNARLARQMEREKTSESRRHIKLVTTVAASAACAVLVIGAAFAIVGGNSLSLENSSGDNASGEYAGAADSNSDDVWEENIFADEGAYAPEADDYDGENAEIQGDDFSYEIGGMDMASRLNWYQEGLTDRQVFERLQERLKEDLEKLYVSEKETFDSDGLLSNEEASELVSQIENGTAADLCAGTDKNYMAVFSDGSVAKFTVRTNNTLYIKGIETVFEF